APQLRRVIRERNVERRARRAGGREPLMEEVLVDGERVAERRAHRLCVEDLLLVDERQPLDEVVHRADLLGLDLVTIEELPVHRAARVGVLDRRLQLPQMQLVELGPRHGLRVRVPELLRLDRGLVEGHCVSVSELWARTTAGGLIQARAGSVTPVLPKTTAPDLPTAELCANLTRAG